MRARTTHRNARPQLHVGRSTDGLKWEIENEIIAYITWYDDFPGPSIGLGRTKDFRTFVKMENPLMPHNRNGVLFPRRIGGQYAMLSRPSDNGHTPFGDIIISYSPDLTYWGKHRLVMRRSQHGWWQSTKIGAGPVPIETRAGWLLFYHGVITTATATCTAWAPRSSISTAPPTPTPPSLSATWTSS